jgi:hypothetical protein
MRRLRYSARNGAAKIKQAVIGKPPAFAENGFSGVGIVLGFQFNARKTVCSTFPFVKTKTERC